MSYRSHPVSPCENPNDNVAQGPSQDEKDEAGARQATPIDTDEDHGRSDAQQAEAEAGGDRDDLEGADEDVEEEHERQRPVRHPELPSREMIAEHNLTHIPYRPWCRACLRGKGKRRPSLRLTGEYAEEHCTRVRMDYASLTEKADESEVEPDAEAEEELVQTVLVMQESQCTSVWSYAVSHKGSSEEWVVHQVCEDLETVGLRNERVIAKSDQENSAVDVVREVAKLRSTVFGTAIENSAVGESNTNATIERAVQDVGAQCRTLRAALEERIGARVRLDHPVVPWLIRHAGYLITRCRVRPSGRTAFQMMKGRRSNTKLFEFGENLSFMIPKTKDMPGK